MTATRANRRRGGFRRVPWSVFLALALVSCIQLSFGAELEKVRLQLQWKHQFEFAGFYAAREKGFYAEAGLDVELIEFESGINPVRRVVSGDVQFAVGYSSIIAEYLKGQPLVLLANFLKRSPIAIVAQPNIRSPRDLAGKKVMGIADNVGDITLAMMLKKFDVDLSSIVNVVPTYSVDAFLEGAVDAMVVFTTNEVFDIEAAGKPYTLFDPSLYGAEYYDVNLFTSRAELIKNPSRVKRFREASIRGWQYALQNQSEIIALIRERYNSQNKSEEALQFEAGQIWSAMMIRVHPIGAVDEQRIGLIGSDFVDIGVLPEGTVLDFDDFLYKQPSMDLELTGSEQQYLSNRGPITFCADPDWMPFERIEDGVHVGMSADYLALFSEKIGTPFVLVPTRSWEQSLNYARQRRCDLFSLAMPTPERLGYMSFTSPYLSFPLVIATRTETLFIDSITEVLDRPLGVVKGYAFTEILRRKYPGINLHETDSLADGLRQVAGGHLFGFIDTLGTIGHILQKDYIGELKIAGKFNEHWSLGIGVRNDDPVLLNILEKAVASVKSDEQQRISNKWISVTFEKGRDYGPILEILAAALLVFLLLGYHMLMQSRYVRRLKAANDEIKEKNRLLEQLSVTDALTGLFNRSKLDEVLRREMTLHERYATPFSIVLIDVDHFKSVNDTFGHLEGDRLLKEFSGLLCGNIRKSDVLGRWGGEEFLIVCSNTNGVNATSMAEHLRQIVKVRDFGLGRSITISAGTAQIENGQSLAQLLSSADKALYDAKHEGRDRVMAAG